MRSKTFTNWLRAALLVVILGASGAQAFEHRHTPWNDLLAQHVKIATDGYSSRVDYSAMAGKRIILTDYLKSLSEVRETEYMSWSVPHRLAFLINAYNAWTVELILQNYPGIQSIKDIGTVFQSPWKKRFIPLLDREISLDDIEHGLIRAPGVFDEPRIHAAVVCAAVGCPMLRAEAYVADRLDQQLEEAMRRFLSDRTRNRLDARTGTLQVSKIFDWYAKDFEKGHQGFDSLRSTFARYALQLAADSAGRQRITQGDYRLKFLDYDWRLNGIDNPEKP
jgi:Protein of unknown function, DUF547